MKAAKSILLVILVLLVSCGPGRQKEAGPGIADASLLNVPVDNGFTEYISGFTNGVVSVTTAIEIRFTPSFAATADKKKLTGIFEFKPAIKGKAEWTDDFTLVFRPARFLDYGTFYSGTLHISKLGEVNSRLKDFPVRIMTLKKDFTVNIRNLESTAEGDSYNLPGELITSDYIDHAEVESYVEAKLDKKKISVTWDHSSTENNHRFIIEKIPQTDTEKELIVSWDGTKSGIKQSASSTIIIPRKNDFSIQNVNLINGESQRVEIVLTDQIDATQELDGLVYFEPAVEFTTQVNSNILTLFPVSTLQGSYELSIESSIKSTKGVQLRESRREALEFSTLKPAVEIVGKGIIMPASGSLVLPFRTANLKAVDVRIIKIFENNLPYFLQTNDLNETGYFKRFGRVAWFGKIDLTGISSSNSGKWNLNTIDLADYITVEPGVLYMVKLGMRRSYSLYNCNDNSGPGKYEQALIEAEKNSEAWWDDPDNYYGDYESSLFYGYGYEWDERDDPCKDSYYSPNRSRTRCLLASNLGIMAKAGEGNKLSVYVNDIRTTDPVGDATVEVYNYQIQVIGSANTASDGSVAIECSGKPFLLIVKKGSDRNYLKTTDGSSLSLSSFDVAGVSPQKGIKAFIYGERDVWRPGDSIYLSAFIRDLTHSLPAGHPVSFELINPQGQRVDNQIQQLPAGGHMAFRTRTSADAVTGNYEAVMKIGGATFSKRVRIETIKPNRLKVELAFPKELLGTTGETERGTINVKWMNGAVAKNLATTVELLLRPASTSFSTYPGYVFEDPATTFDHTSTKIFDGSIDDRGTAVFDFDPSQGQGAPGMLNAIFTTRVMEKGGDASIISKSLKFSPYKVYSGVSIPAPEGKGSMLLTDTPNEVKVVTVDMYGKPVSSEVEVNIYRLTYRWWWESDEDNLGTYISTSNYKPVVTKKIQTVNGAGSMSFTVNKYDWGRYLVRVTAKSGHSAGKIIYIDWPWEYGQRSSTQGANILTINTDKEKYNAGENIRVMFPAPANSRAIVTIENAAGILEQMSVSVSGTNSFVNLKAKPEWAPNVYAFITLLQPHGQTANDMPVRLYGVVPIAVEDKETRLSPQISMPDEVRSQESFEIRVSETNKKGMTYTIAVVDEGLLDLTGFKTPDPWSYFYAREALGVRTWDIYDMVLGAFGGTLDRAMATGGDEALKDKGAAKAKRFIPIVRFLGPYELGPSRTNTHKITLPQYTGSVRAMVVAGAENAFGFSEKQVYVRDPLMILATAPRVLSPGEKVSLPVTLFVQKDNIRKVTLEVSGNEMIRFSEKKKEISISAVGESDVDFEFTTAEKTGKAEITVTASGGGEKAVYKIEVEVRSPNPPETRSELVILKPGEKFLKTFMPFGMEGTSSASVEISSLPSVNMKKRLAYLVEYPHGCSEQITSGVFPQLWIKEISGNDPDAIKSASTNVSTGIYMLSTRQLGNGGIVLWPGSGEPDRWVTSYAGHFILEAERLGYSIPSGFKQKWIGFQRRAAQQWRYENSYRHNTTEQAYRLFTLALAGQPEKGAMNRLRETPNLPNMSRWLLAATFSITGRKEVADQLIDTRSMQGDPDYYDYYYGGALRDKSIMIFTLVTLNRTEEALPLLKSLCDDLNRDYWYPTQSVAWGLFSYMKFAASMPADNSKNSNVMVSVNGVKKDVTVTPKSVITEQLKLTDNNTLLVENTSQNPLYVTFSLKGVPFRSDLAKEEKGLTMTVRYINMDQTILDESSLVQGTDFAMLVSVTNKTFRRVDNIALTQMVPSGWEIRNTRLFDADWGIKESPMDYRDYRDDRVYTYFGLSSGETRNFVVLLNAAYKGKYYQPSVWCEAMYTENCYARIPGKEVEVTGVKIE